MDSKLAEKYFNETLVKNYPFFLENIPEQITREEDYCRCDCANKKISAFVSVLDISGFTGGRSIAHMLSPIKPIACENSSQKSLTLLQCPQDAINIQDPIVTSTFSIPSWSSQQLHSSFNHPISTCASRICHVEEGSSVLSDPIVPIAKEQNENAEMQSTNPTSKSVNMNSTSCETTPTIQVHSPLNCSDKTEADSTPLEVSFHKPAVERTDVSKKINVQEIAATYKELDTLSLARKVKDVLVANNIGQRIFGQAVLGLTQGSVSDLLSHPKSWHTLSLKGREPFIRMQLWLENPNNVELIRNLKSEKQAEHNVSGGSSNRIRSLSSKKKSRVVLSMDEKGILLEAYSLEPYPSQNTVHELARKLGKKPSTIVNWFHNYRSRVKRGFFSCSDTKKSKENQNSKDTTTWRDKNSKDATTSNELHENEDLCSSHASSISTKLLKSVTKEKVIDSVSSSAIDLTKNSSKNSSMRLTATLLLGTTSQPVTPLWSFHVANSRSMLTPNGNLKTFILNVCGSSKPDTPPETEFNLPQASDANNPVNLRDLKQSSVSETVTSS